MLCPEEYRRDKGSYKSKGNERIEKENKGFTLAELLIVVAIIAILVAVSVPMFNNQLTGARKATNQANARAAQSAALAEYMMNQLTGQAASYTYNLQTGAISKDSTTATGGIAFSAITGAQQYTAIQVCIDASGNVTFIVTPAESAG